MAERPQGRVGRRLSAIADLALAAETATWITAWLILPALLALRSSPFASFLLYSIGAAFLLGIGTLLTHRHWFGTTAPQIAFHAAQCWLALLVAGSIAYWLVRILA
jgi:hypothetical protein